MSSVSSLLVEDHGINKNRSATFGISIETEDQVAQDEQVDTIISTRPSINQGRETQSRTI